MATNTIEYEQKEDFVIQEFTLDNDASLVLNNSENYLTENTLVITNLDGNKELSLSIDVTNLVNALCDTELPLSVKIDGSIIINIKYTKELTAIISVKSGLTNIR